MSYRQGRDPREVANELYGEALAAELEAELGHQNALTGFAVARFELRRARVELGHLVEIERDQRAALTASNSPVPDVEAEDVARVRAAVVSAEAALEAARIAVEQSHELKAEAARRLREAKAEVDRVR